MKKQNVLGRALVGGVLAISVAMAPVVAAAPAQAAFNPKACLYDKGWGKVTKIDKQGHKWRVWVDGKKKDKNGCYIGVWKRVG